MCVCVCVIGSLIYNEMFGRDTFALTSVRLSSLCVSFFLFVCSNALGVET